MLILPRVNKAWSTHLNDNDGNDMDALNDDEGGEVINYINHVKEDDP